MRPVWLLLKPRDYLSTCVKLGTNSVLLVGGFLVNPDIRFPAFTSFVGGGGPIIKGKFLPFLFVTTVNLDMFSQEVSEKLAGRTGGAVSLGWPSGWRRFPRAAWHESTDG